MTATFEVVLDTHAPVLSVSPGQWAPLTRTLSIPYSLDEPAVLTASFAPFHSAVSYPLYAVEGALVGVLPDGIDGGNGVALVSAADDVLNSAAYTLTIGREPVHQPQVYEWTRSLSTWQGYDEPVLRMYGVSPAEPGSRPGKNDPASFLRRGR